MIINFSPDLQDIFPAQVDVKANTIWDALYGICIQHPLNGLIQPRQVYVEGYQTIIGLRNANPNEITVKSYAYAGAGGKPGVTQLAIAAVLFLVAMPFAAGALNLSAATIATLKINAAAMALGGIMSILTPAPKLQQTDNRRSGFFSNQKTTTKLGTPIQMTFGRRLVAPQIISFNMAVLDTDGKDYPAGLPEFDKKAREELGEGRLTRFYGVINRSKQKIVQVEPTRRTGSAFV